VKVVEFPTLDRPETKRAVQLLEQWGCQGKVLLVVGSERLDDNLFLSLRNLGHVLAVSSPTAYRVLAADTIIISKSAFDAAKEEAK
jgi:ribosomal protein L4